MDSWVFFILDVAILVFVIRVDMHLARIERNTRKDEEDDRPARFE